MVYLLAIVVFLLGMSATALNLRIVIQRRPLRALILPTTMLLIGLGVVITARPIDLSLIFLFSFIPGIYVSYLFIPGQPKSEEEASASTE